MRLSSSEIDDLPPGLRAVDIVWSQMLLLVVLTACGDSVDRQVPPGTPVSALPGVYAGQFPCVNCPAISTTLWLRADGRYFIRQQYLADENDAEATAFGLGRWDWVDADRTVVLTGEGPQRIFTWPDHDTLIMRTQSDLEHRLVRAPGAPEFGSSIRMAGTMTMAGAGALFTECATGLEAPVEKGGDYRRLLHQYRSVAGVGERALVEIEGRFSWSTDGAPASLTIDRLVTVKEGRRDCRP